LDPRVEEQRVEKLSLSRQLPGTDVGYNQARLYRIKIEEQTNTYQETANLASVRFNGGVTSFLEVLVTQQQYFTSQVTLAACNAELQNYVQLHQALGGGWQT